MYKKHIFEGIGELISLPSSTKPNQRVFLGSTVATLLEHSNLTTALKTAGGIKFNGNNKLESDYAVIKRKGNEEFFNNLIKSGENEPTKLNLVGSIHKFSTSITLLSESGVWKLAMTSKSKKGKQLREWLAREVLPSISSTGVYAAPAVTKQSKYHQYQEMLRLKDVSEQKLESKEVNSFQYEKKNNVFDIINYNKENHKQVHGRTTKELKEKYNAPKGKSGKEVLREHEPEYAITMAFNDFMVKQGADLSSLREIDKAFPALARAFLDYGFEVNEIFPVDK